MWKQSVQTIFAGIVALASKDNEQNINDTTIRRLGKKEFKEEFRLWQKCNTHEEFYVRITIAYELFR